MNTANVAVAAAVAATPYQSTLYRISSGPNLDRIVDSFRYEGMIPVNFDVVDSLGGGILALTNFRINKVSKDDTYPKGTIDISGTCTLSDSSKVVSILGIKDSKYEFEANYNTKTRQGFIELKKSK